MTSITTLIPLPPDLVERDRVRRQAQRAGAVSHPGLARLQEVTFAGEGLALVWEIPCADDTPLETPVSVVTALAPIAAGLATLHDAGLAHGGIAPSAIHLCEGHGVLSGWRPGGTPAGDVRDLTAVLEAWLPPASVGADIAQIIIAVHDPDPQARPSMAKLAAALDRAARSGTPGHPTAADARGTPPISPPAHRRARIAQAPPPRHADVEAAAVPPLRTLSPQSVPAGARGRHAARRSPAGSPALSWTGIRVPWRWGLAFAGTVAAVFFGFTAVGSAGSAQEICPAPVSGSALMTVR
jgi:hypothetical protein